MNPIIFVLALIVTILVIKAFLQKKYGKYPDVIMGILVICGLIFIGYPSIIEMMAIAIPYTALLFIGLFFIGFMYLGLGAKTSKIYPMMKNIGLIKTGVIIALVCIFIFAGSNVYGQTLLEDKSVSFGDALMVEEEPTQVDFSWLFQKQALGLMLIFAVIGCAYFFIIIAK